MHKAGIGRITGEFEKTPRGLALQVIVRHSVVKLLFIFGTRPEAIKMAPIIRAARNSPELDVRICVTGQHRDLLDQVLDFFCICPDHDLAAMQHDQNLSGLTARILEGLRPILLAERPDFVLVQGDTISAFAGALAAFFENIPVGHVEAGLRTHDLSAPFPEEGLRQMITRLANLHFAPTEKNVAALLDEKVSIENICLTGNPGVDAVLWTRDHVRRSRINPLSRYLGRCATDHIDHAEHVILVTGHRRENFGSGLQGICAALAEIADQHPYTAIVYPVHPNPNVRDHVYTWLGPHRNIFLLPPVDYPAFVHLMDISSLIVTDSGGVQEEAPALGKPVLVTRRSTERTEALDSGGARVVGTETSEIVLAIKEVFDRRDGCDRKWPPTMPFGDGSAAEKIVRIIEQRTFAENRFSASIQALIAAVGYSGQLAAQADGEYSMPEPDHNFR